jgi:hypothetical protein
VRVVTLDPPESAECVPTNIHIYVSTKPWLVLYPDLPVVDDHYDIEEIWPPENLKRRKLYMRRFWRIELRSLFDLIERLVNLRLKWASVAKFVYERQQQMISHGVFIMLNRAC